MLIRSLQLSSLDTMACAPIWTTLGVVCETMGSNDVAYQALTLAQSADPTFMGLWSALVRFSLNFINF
jgi:hypothetical protein